jgi:hypothetical protein
MIGGEMEVLGANLPQCCSGYHRSHTFLAPVLNPGQRRVIPTANRLSYGKEEICLLHFRPYPLECRVAKLLQHSTLLCEQVLDVRGVEERRIRERK